MNSSTAMPRVTRQTRAARAARALASLPAATLHERGGDARLDAALALAELAVNGGADALDRVCAHVARACAVDVCSLYVREEPVRDPAAPAARPAAAAAEEERDELILRATRGLPRRAVGTVHIPVGEGLTGAAAACARPVSVAALDTDARNFAVAGLGEERFPALCAIPLIESGRVIAVLVVQRRERRAWSADEVARLASLSAVVLVVLIRVRETQRLEAHRASELAAGGICIRGAGVGTGVGVGPAYVVAGPSGAYTPSNTAAFAKACPIDRGAERARLEHALVEARADLAALVVPALRRLQPGPALRALLGYSQLLEDSRLEDAAMDEIQRGAPAEVALERVARTYARVLGGSDDAHLRDRADDFDEAIGRVFDRLGGIGAAPSAPLGSILVATRLSMGGALAAYSRRPSGLLTETPATAASANLLATLGVPVVASAIGALAFIRGGDTLMVDAEAGHVLVRPSRAQIADARRRRRASRTASGSGSNTPHEAGNA